MDVVFLRTKNYDNSRCVRKLYFFREPEDSFELKEVKPVWAWAVRKEDVSDFLQEYSDVEWDVVDVKEKYVYAVDFRTVDEMLTTTDAKKAIELFRTLKIEPFDTGKCVRKKSVGFDDGWDYMCWTVFESDYAVIVFGEEPEIVAIDKKPVKCPFDAEDFGFF